MAARNLHPVDAQALALLLDDEFNCFFFLKVTLSFFLGFTDSLVQLEERSRLLAVLYGGKSAASGQWCTILGSGVCGQDPSRVGGVLGGGVHRK